MRFRKRLAVGDDRGFGLIEMVVALLIAGIVFTALATTLIASVQASLYSRQNQQATDFMTREIEQMRTLSYGALANRTSDLAGDTRLSSCGIQKCLDVNGADAGGLEPIATGTAGSVYPHTTVLTAAETNKTDFTVSRYVTVAPDQPAGQALRATVYITWQNKGVTKTRSLSTMIAYTQRGLPLPVFKLALPTSSITVARNAAATFALTLTNQGASDRFNLSLTSPSSGWSWYADTDGDGSLDTTIDQLLTDHTSDGIRDTGRLDPSTTFRFFVTRTTGAAETLATTATTITATSFGQPGAAGAVQSVIGTTTVVSGIATPPPPPPPSSPPPVVPPETTCAATVIETPDAAAGGYTLRQYALHNDGLGDSALQAQMYFNSLAQDENGLPHYSTDISSTITGRMVAPGAATTPTGAVAIGLGDKTKFADWALQYGAKTRINGTGVLRLWVARSGAGAGAVGLKVVVYSGTGSSTGLTRTVLAEKDVTLGTLTCAGFQEVYVKLPTINAVWIQKNDWLGVRVVPVGTDTVRFAYDSAGQFPASFTMGVK
ncbi:MAG TPA: type II secretion system protein [Propionicimonas sp.]|jgi:prepilin-type N-terminal cleavage/methylation domain-containing protein|uniref:type IV pilus modification PilV family protein n=1 Tax=Propionicimonas sp. TaxID=1955623 RepID=UPI002F41D3DD